MDIKAYGETEQAVVFAATWEAFKTKDENRKGREWQEAYFELMSINNTYSVFYEMGIKDYRVSDGVYSVRYYLVSKKAFAKNVREWLEDRFTEFDEWEDTIALINTWDMTDVKGNDVDVYGVYEG